jgi:anthranilate synthase/aminodeoxychorismate synthase-like glutamine amidotransferase
MKILLIDNYDSFTYNLYHYLSYFKCKVEVFRNDKIGINEIKKNNYSKIVISPGPGSPNQSGNCLKIVKHFYKTIPILGVCLGHQIIGQIFKCKIVEAKKLMHGKTSLINHNQKGIFKGIKKVISATRYHSLIISKKNFSSDLIITAETKDKVIMGIMHKKYNIHGVQFHPESIKTPFGLKILKNFINYK